MEYNENIWTEYTKENESSSESGCNIGYNLSSFDSSFDVTGVDLNDYALQKAKENFPSFNFYKSNIIDLPFENDEFDFIFTRGVLIHINKNDIQKVLSELSRISSKWIMNIEYFGLDGKAIEWKRGNDLLWYRNMKELWEKNNMKVITDIDLPISMDKDQTRLTLVCKNYDSF